MLYTHKKTVSPPPLPKLTQQIVAPQTATNSRSRNATDAALLKGNAAGQSTVSYFNTKRSFTSTSLQRVLSTDESSEGNGKTDGAQMTADGQPVIQGDFFNMLRQELRDGSDATIK